jgi:hypothetical protein
MNTPTRATFLASILTVHPREISSALIQALDRVHVQEHVAHRHDHRPYFSVTQVAVQSKVHPLYETVYQALVADGSWRVRVLKGRTRDVDIGRLAAILGAGRRLGAGR